MKIHSYKKIQNQAITVLLMNKRVTEISKAQFKCILPAAVQQRTLFLCKNCVLRFKTKNCKNNYNTTRPVEKSVFDVNYDIHNAVHVGAYRDDHDDIHDDANDVHDA